MNWRRIHTDANPKHYKEWRGGRGCYRITWRDQVCGVTVAPGYHICIREGDRWELIKPGARLKRTLKAAKRACELHANPPQKRK